MKRILWIGVALTALFGLILSAGCTEPTPEVIIQTEVVEKEGETVIEEKVITATPEPVEPTASPYDENAEILVWVDATRLTAVEQFIDQFPEKGKLIRTSVVDRGEFPAKVLLFNNVGEGWPDVMFMEPRFVARVADAAHDYPADLTPWVSQDIIDGFAPGSLESCTFDGKLLCLRNDLAQSVLYYDVNLMDELGYDVPTTWEEYIALGEDVAANNPGYYIGTCGGAQCLNYYFWPSQCPVSQELSVSEMRVNPTHPNCVRPAQMLDQLIDLGVVDTVAPFEESFVNKVKEGKVLMQPAASWFGEYIYGGKEDSMYYQTAEGQIGVALSPKWEDQDEHWSGAHGGSAWSMSRHTKNPKLASELIVWLTTSEYQHTAPTFPAYLPAAEEWAQTISGNPLYAFDPYPVMEEAAGLIWPGWSEARLDFWPAWSTVVIENVRAGGTIEEALPMYQEELIPLAAEQGYEVITEGITYPELE